VSVKPRFAEALLSGKKTVELRKKTPIPNKGDEIYVYAKVPQKELVGSVICEGVVVGTLPELWRQVRTRAAVSKEEFDAYFGSRKTGVGIVVKDAWRFARPLPLADIPGFHPPQSPIRIPDSLWKVLANRPGTRRR
jgi:predicted transcriptional regulator